MKDRAEILLFNKCFGNERELFKQFNEVRQLNPKLSKPVMHITLSLSPGEFLGNDKLMELSEHCAKEFGFENNQYIGVSHRDTGHQHLHIIANRIGFDKRTVSDSNSYKRIANYCRKMEMKYSLKQVQNPARYQTKEQRNTPRLDHRKERLRQHIREALKNSCDFSQFEKEMTERGYEIIKGRGISFADEKKVKFKGSELNYSLQTIERILETQRALQSIKLKECGSEKTQVKLKTDELAPEFKNKGSLQNILQEVIKPEQSQQEIGNTFLPKKRRKKQRRSQRL